jgi:hypothetical protein
MDMVLFQSLLHDTVASECAALACLGHGPHLSLEETVEAVVDLGRIVVLFNLGEDLVHVLGPKKSWLIIYWLIGFFPQSQG